MPKLYNVIHFTACVNRFVMVDFDQAASTLTCQFQSTTQSSAERMCSVKYSVCDQEEIFSNEGNSTTMVSSDKVILPLRLPSGSDCYTYRVTASDGTNTVVVEGTNDQRGKHVVAKLLSLIC